MLGAHRADRGDRDRLSARGDDRPLVIGHATAQPHLYPASTSGQVHRAVLREEIVVQPQLIPGSER